MSAEEFDPETTREDLIFCLQRLAHFVDKENAGFRQLKMATERATTAAKDGAIAESKDWNDIAEAISRSLNGNMYWADEYRAKVRKHLKEESRSANEAQVEVPQ